MLLFEDTCILTEGVSYEDVLSVIRGCAAGVFGYGHHANHGGKISWHGTKGLFMTPYWCERMAITFQNMHVRQFRHVDNWLAGRVRDGQELDFQLLRPLGSYGHRVSQTQNTSELCFGGHRERGFRSTHTGAAHE